MNVQTSVLVRFKALFVIFGLCVILAGCGNEGLITKTVTGRTYTAEAELGVVIVAPNAMSADEMDAWIKGLANLPKSDDIRRPVAKALVADGHWPKGRLDAAMFYLFDNVQAEVIDEGAGVKISAVGDTEKMAQCIADATAAEIIRMLELSRGEGVLRGAPDLPKALQEHTEWARDSRLAMFKIVKELRVDPEEVARLDEKNTNPEISGKLSVYRAERDALRDLRVDLASPHGDRTGG